MDQKLSRVVVLIDMDCFYCQVEEQLDPNLIGKPIVVVQYNEWKGGGIIAVNYEARKWGVQRHMRGKEAKEKCPELNIVSVPEFRGRANLNKYREAGKRVINVLLTFTKLVQRASIDEAYLDITNEVEKRLQTFRRDDLKEIESKLPNTFVVGFDQMNEFIKTNMNNDNLQLLIGAIIVEEMRSEIFKITGYKCTAGIANNKILAKLVCSLHKPNKQTILPHESLDQFLATVPIHKIHSLGGKFGNSLIDQLKITNILQLRSYSEENLMKMYDSRLGSWLYNICRGIDTEPVTPRFSAQSVGCSKKFPGRATLKNETDVKYWLNELSTELIERLSNDTIENKRYATQIVLHFAQNENFTSKSWNLTRKMNLDRKEDCLKYLMENLSTILRKNGLFGAAANLCITYLGLSASKFQNNVKDIIDLFDNIKCNKQKQEDSISSFCINWIENRLQMKLKTIQCPICNTKINIEQDSNDLKKHLQLCYETQRNIVKK